MQLKGELCRIFGDDNIPQNIRSKFQKTWGPKILKYAEQKKGLSSYLDEMKAALTENDINPTGTVSKRRDSSRTLLLAKNIFKTILGPCCGCTVYINFDICLSCVIWLFPFLCTWIFCESQIRLRGLIEKLCLTIT